MSPARLSALAIVAAVALGTGGMAWEYARFGPDVTSASQRLEAEVQQRLGKSASHLAQSAAEVASQGALISAAVLSRDRLPELFASLHGAAASALTVYVRTGTGEFRVLAWSDGAAEDLEVPIAAHESPVILVAQGTLGLRLVAWHPVRIDDRLVGVVAAEEVLATTGGLHPGLGEYRLSTSFGPVRAILPAVSAPRLPDGVRATVLHAGAVPMLDVIIAPAQLATARTAFRHQTLFAAAFPLAGALLLLAATLPRSRHGARALMPALLVAGAGVLLGRAAMLAAASDLTMAGIAALTGVGLCLTLPVTFWWRSAGHRAPVHTARVRLPVEIIGAGLLAAVLLWATYWTIDWQLGLIGDDRLASPLFPPSPTALMTHMTRIALAIASVWAVATLLARTAERWRLSWRRPVAALLTAAAWVLPTAIVVVPRLDRPLPVPAVLTIALATAVFALSAVRLRHWYRHASESARLLSLCVAIIIPALLWYPVVAFSTDRGTERLIQTSYAPALLGHPQQLRDELTQATEDIDRVPDLAAVVATPVADIKTTSTDAAFLIWSQTGLSRSRLTSALELYGPDGRLSSRFALNVPEYGSDQSSTETRCHWDTYGEVTTFGAKELVMLHAERSICDPAGRALGSVVVHVLFDYRALPFISAINPYDDLLRLAGGSQQPRSQGIQTVVYGWGRVPTFTSGQTAWPLDPELLARIEKSRTPFWTRRVVGSGTFEVYFANDRAGIYALGYPATSGFDHLARLAETAVLAALVFLVMLMMTTAMASLVRQPGSPLRALMSEVRTSFYRKLFLFFVFTAVVPVVVLAFTFSAYMSDKLRSDVETEALNSAIIARRVLEDTIALQQVPPTDDVLVWIGQVINQDVNLYEGSQLRATSQRDLFDSGLLPERTPAGVYRSISLLRLPSFVAEERAGLFRYLVAAAPVPGLGRQAVLSVPLALRQQEIELEITDLNRGVVLGAVLVILLAASIGASVAQRVSDPVARLTRATRQIAAGRLDVRIVADTADELQRLVDDFNTMAATLRAQRAELVRTHELKAWAEMSRQVAHDIKNPLTPIQLAAEHLQRVHQDSGRPLGAVFDQCTTTVLRQVRLLRQIANEFATFASVPDPHLTAVPLGPLLAEVVEPYLAGLTPRTRIEVAVAPATPAALADRTLLARALTNLIENAVQAMPTGGVVRLSAAPADANQVQIVCEDTGVGMTASAAARAFDPHFSTKTGGSGLGLASARRNLEACGGTIILESAEGIGTVVRVTLPAAISPDAPASE